MTRRRRHAARRGFTLIELLLVMVIIAVLAALVLPRIAGRGDKAKIDATNAQVRSLFTTAISMYEVDNGFFPTTAQGLDALRSKPTSAPEPKHWKQPYLQGDVPLDGWGNPFGYRCPGTQNVDGYDLWSNGPDGREGSDDDIVNWSTTTA